MYGAGNIGRGFIGKTFSESGYEVCFVDVVKHLVDKLNMDRSYPVKIVSNEDSEEVCVKNVHAVNGMDVDRVAEEIAAADVMATAVGVNVLPKIVRPLSEGLKKRFDTIGRPINIIVCENMLDADKYLRGMIEEEMGEKYKAVLDEKLGLVEASIGRMVPVMTDEMREGNILRVWVEPYDKLPVDKEAFVGEIPKLNRLEPFSPFGFCIKRKLFIHNMGHAMCAYMGWQKGYTYIYECVRDAVIQRTVRAAMMDSASALSKAYGIAKEELEAHVDDLLYRFGNRELGDTVVRVGKDPIRKLGQNDRLVGAAKYCESIGIKNGNIAIGIAAGLEFDNTKDEGAKKMRETIELKGIRFFLESHCKIDADSKLMDRIISAANRLTIET